MSVSVRRHFVDGFFRAHESLYRQGAVVADVGGRRHNKRGTFDIGAYPCAVTYVNVDPVAGPDILADAKSIPLPDASFDLVLMGELLEHVPNPSAVLREGFRVLRPGGTLLATVPFMYPVHADPHDYGRYTRTYWQETAQTAGFSGALVEPQGTLYAVGALLVQYFFAVRGIGTLTRPLKSLGRRLLRTPLIRLLMWLDRRAKPPLFNAWTTGYGLTLSK